MADRCPWADALAAALEEHRTRLAGESDCWTESIGKAGACSHLWDHESETTGVATVIAPDATPCPQDAPIPCLRNTEYFNDKLNNFAEGTERIIL
jgi:hypothetical protein